MLVNQDLLIDPNPTVPEAMASFGADGGKIRNVLISHSHGDHYSPDTLLWLAADHPVTVYGDGGYPQKLPRHPNLTFVPVEQGREYLAGGYRVTALRSTHTVEGERRADTPLPPHRRGEESLLRLRRGLDAAHHL